MSTHSWKACSQLKPMDTARVSMSVTIALSNAAPVHSKSERKSSIAIMRKDIMDCTRAKIKRSRMPSLKTATWMPKRCIPKQRLQEKLKPSILMIRTKERGPNPLAIVSSLIADSMVPKVIPTRPIVMHAHRKPTSNSPTVSRKVDTSRLPECSNPCRRMYGRLSVSSTRAITARRKPMQRPHTSFSHSSATSTHVSSVSSTTPSQFIIAIRTFVENHIIIMKKRKANGTTAIVSHIESYC
mmetsp:Transcript_51602/g.90701  ORF Transcript_51602/g.90701 Transcript_51602/m.90701 type:complete len:241 (-) Transcript_51602:207-929(-)